jgi:hypothetical protein
MMFPLFQQYRVQVIGNTQVNAEAQAVEENKTASKEIQEM